MKVMFEYKKIQKFRKIFVLLRKVRRDSGKRKKKAEILKDIPLKSREIK